MRIVTCHECGKRYDYDEDAFCTRCGAFNQPQRSACIDRNGEVVRREGINEQGHAHSFAHAEFHEENRKRRKTGLDKSVPRSAQRKSPSDDTGREGAAKATPRKNRSGKKGMQSAVGWVILLLFLLNALRSCASVF